MYYIYIVYVLYIFGFVLNFDVSSLQLIRWCLYVLLRAGYLFVPGEAIHAFC